MSAEIKLNLIKRIRLFRGILGHYLIILLSCHVGPQEALDGDSCQALLLIVSPVHPHTHVLLDDNGCSGSS